MQSLRTLPDLVEVTYPDHSSYIGQIGPDKIRTGKGIYTYSEGDVYFGTWKDDEFHGEGVYIHSNGEVYEGLVQQGLMEGRGIYHYSNSNAYYCGNWHRGEKHGEGIYYS